MTARKRWVEARPSGTEAELARHAAILDHQPYRGQRILTLCGVYGVVTPAEPGMPAGECEDCDRVWRDSEGIERRDVHLEAMSAAHRRR